MITNYANYKVKPREDTYTTKSGKVYKATAAISFYDEYKKEVAYLERAYIEAEDIYESIANGESIDISECYVENFSISTYRKKHNLDKDVYIKIKEFCAKDAFFESRIKTDFSFIEFDSKKTDFGNCTFLNGSTSFNSCIFLNGDVDFSYCFFCNGNVDFTNTKFNEGKIEFKNSKFGTGHKDFQYADFGIGTNSFVNTDFGDGDVSFVNVNFNDGKTSFKVARFGTGKIDFHFSHFGSDDISFERTDFGHGKVDFRKVEFGTGKVNFNRSVFGEGDVSFEGCTIPKGRITFLKTTFISGNISFEICEFNNADLIFNNTAFGLGNVYFTQSQFHKLTFTSCHLNNYVDLRVEKCSYLDLSDTIVRDIIDITPYEYDVNIKILNLSGMRLLGQIYIDWKLNNVKKIISRQEKATFRVKSEQFRLLKENYRSIGNYKYEDFAYIQFKRNEMKAELREAVNKKKVSALWQYPFYLFKQLIIDRMGLYATSPARVMTSLILIYLFFSIIHIVLPHLINTSINCIPEDAGFIKQTLDTLYYSLITFTTVGYGDCSPVGFLRFVAMIEGFVGPFMMSYFTVAFARKILR